MATKPLSQMTLAERKVYNSERQAAFRKRERAKKIAAGGFEQSFTYKGKTYTLPKRFPKKDIPTLISFLKSFDEWRAGGGSFESFKTMPSRVKSRAAGLKIGKKTSKFDNKEGRVWRRLVQYAKGKPPVPPGGTGTGDMYKTFFDQLEVSKPQLNTIKTFDFKNIQAAKQKAITPLAQKANVGNPLVTNVLDVVRKDPTITEQELFSGVRKLSKGPVSNGQIVNAAVQAHRRGSERLLREARKEKIGEFQLKNIQKFSSQELPPALKTIYNLFPNKVGRDFSTTIKNFYKDNPTLKKRALDKLKAYGKIRSEVQKVLTESGVKIGGKGPGRAAFQFDHPISFAALDRSKDIAGAIRTNPIVGDVNQFKGRFLDRRLNFLQNAIMRGENVTENIAKVEKLKNINQTLLGNLAGDFTINEKGIIKVKDYGAPTILDKQYDIARSLQKNLPLGGQIKRTLASGALTADLEQVLGKESASKMIKSSQRLIEFAKKDVNKICRIFGGAKLASGGQGCGAQMAQALDNDPVGTANKINDLKVGGGAVNRIKNAATTFLKFAGKGKGFAIGAGIGVGAGALVKKFMNDDPSTYLTNDKQANAMILDTIDQKERQERMDAIGDAPELLDEANIAANIGVTAAAVPGASAVYQARRKPFTRIVDGVKKTRPAMGPARAALGPVGKALSGFATPAGIAALTPLNVASSLYEGDSAYDIATDPVNYLGPALAGRFTAETTRGMGATSKLAKSLRLGMSPGAIKMVSKRFGLPGLALSAGISLYELADDYKSSRGIFGKKE
jgi:hypothetical protein